MMHVDPAVLLALAGVVFIGFGKMLLEDAEEKGDAGEGQAMLAVILCFIGIMLLGVDFLAVLHYMNKPGG